MKSIIRTKLIWDIDGTLLRTNGAAAIPFSKAVSDFAGVNVEIDRKYLSGFTDYEIAMHLLNSHNILFEMKNITQILNEYVRNLPQSLETIGVEIINTIDQVLEKLSQTPDIDLLIGTGNCLAGAKIKLEHVSLKKFFLDENIYYSSEIDWNRDLVMQKAKNSLSKNEIGIVIGDSPRDIKSAKKSIVLIDNYCDETVLTLLPRLISLDASSVSFPFPQSAAKDILFNFPSGL